MTDHPPAARRAVIRRLRREHPAALVGDARRIQDDGHAGIAMLAVAADERLPAGKAAILIRDAAKRLRGMDRPGRMAETWSDAFQTVSEVHRGPACEAAIATLHDAGVDAIAKIPPGSWASDAVVATAPFLTSDHAERLLRRAIETADVPAAAALLDATPELTNLARSAPAEMASHLLGRRGDADAAIEAAWRIEGRLDRLEALRVLAWRDDSPELLQGIVASARGRADDDRVAVLTMVAGRQDRLGLDAVPTFAKAVDALGRLDGNVAVKAHRKLAAAMDRAGLSPPPAPGAVEAEAEAVTVPTRAGERHVLAIVDGYQGRLGPPHLRAVARAAPLCVAFDLDLCIVGFPTEDAEALVGLVAAETNVGEGEDYARDLLGAGRLRLLPLEHGLPAAWPGHPVATTPHPAEGKGTSLDAVPTPVCLLVGLGKQGLPRKILEGADHHYELTGQGISMETATAMGVLADRLGRLPR